MKLITKLIVSTLAVVISAYILNGVTVDNIPTALVVAVVLGTLNVFVKPILIFLTLPINLITLGLFTFVINVALIMFAAQLIPGFAISSVLWGLLFGLVLSIISAFFNKIAK
ncbi:phage holin family protein [Patescibacteria group bacterium]